MKQILTACLDLLFPRNCLLTHKRLLPTQTGLLSSCGRQLLTDNSPPFCLQCSRHLNTLSDDGLCQTCQRRPPIFDQAWGCLILTPPLKTLLHQFKYQQKPHLAKDFAQIMAAFCHRFLIDLSTYDAVCPLPLHPARRRERGYNQSALLARELNRIFPFSLSENILKRNHNTPHQTGLGRKDRWTNIQGAFTIQSNLILINKSILIIDDLLTTGATASEAARTCKDFGAQRVDVLALALTP